MRGGASQPKSNKTIWSGFWKRHQGISQGVGYLLTKYPTRNS